MQYTEIFFPFVRIEIFIRNSLIFLVFLLKTLIVGTHQNRLSKAVLMSTHNLCFGAKIRNAQNTDCGYTSEPPQRGSSNEYTQSMFWSENKKNRYTTCKPHFHYIKVGLKGVYISRTCFPDVIL